MKRFLRNIILLLGALLVFASCNRPKTIPDDKLEMIFEDIFLANSYYTTAGDRSLRDSVDMYRPILKKYGYKIGDLTYTIENYSKRKSAKISDVVEASIRRLEKQERYYSAVVARRDSMETRAIRQFKRTVYNDSLIQVFSLQDTSKLRITLPVVEGSYEIQYTYMIDSLDQNGRPNVLYQMLDKKGTITQSVNRGMTTRRTTPVWMVINAVPGDATMQIKLAGYGPNMKRPHVTVKFIQIDHNLPVQAALDSLFIYQRNQIYTLPQYVDKSDPDAPYSGPLRVDPPRLAEGRDDNSRP